MSSGYPKILLRNDDEAGRLTALAGYNILDTGRDQAFEDIVELAQRFWSTRVVHIALIDSERQWFKASRGLDISETSRENSFCHYTIQRDSVMVVLDAKTDSRFANSPLVAKPPNTRFYAGAPIINAHGYALGTICLSDPEPRESFDDQDMLMILARQVGALLELHKNLANQRIAVRMAADQRDRLWDNSLDMMLIAHADGSLVAGNPAWEAKFGPINQDGRGNIVDYLAPGEERSPTPMRDGQKDVEIERVLIGKDGHLVYTSWNLAREDDLIFGIARDQTRTKEAEAQLAHVQKMESIGQLTGGIAHDFNNLLTIIIGNLDIAERRIDGGGLDKARQAIGNARDGAERAASLTQRLLAFARRQSLSPKVIKVEELITGLVPLAEQALDDTIRLEMDYPSRLWPVKIDASQLENAILNLIVNARDAIKEGGVIRLNAANRVIHANSVSGFGPKARAGHFIKLCVTDTGSGIPPNVLDRIFEPFFTTKDQGKGTGLGLSQVQGFVEQSGGFVTLKSEQGVGTTVSLWLPAHGGEWKDKDGDNLVADNGAQTSSEALSNAQIIVVEDNASLRSHICEILKEEGCIVRDYADGRKAADAILAMHSPPDLLLSDIKMPVLGGAALAKLSRERFAQLPIILMTGYAGDDLDAQSPHNALIDKPFSRQDLIDAVSGQLSRL